MPAVIAVAAGTGGALAVAGDRPAAAVFDGSPAPRRAAPATIATTTTATRATAARHEIRPGRIVALT